MSLEEKGKHMNDFIKEVIGFFRMKDKECNDIITFKTKCIKTFVQHMTSWLSNWELKQEYLKNLRKEFGTKSI